MRYFGEDKPSLEDLSHFGVKGMKWGVRKSDPGSSGGSTKKEKPFIKEGTESISVKLKNGKTMMMDGNKTPALGKFIAKMSPAFRERLNNGDEYTLRGPDGKAIGEMSLKLESPTSMNVVWVGVNKSARGKGYASAVMQAAVDHARKQGLKTVTLEVPGNSPDARHIYEKMGFKEDPSKSEPWDPVWGGLTAMELDLNAAKHDGLLHYGVKGMKWGVRKEDDTGGSGGSSAKAKIEPNSNQAKANLAKNEQKFKDKFKASDSKSDAKEEKPSFYSRHKSTIIKSAVIAGVVASIYISGKVYEKKMQASISEHLNKPIAADTFASHVAYSKSKTWMQDDYFQQHSYDRDEFSLPAGHLFHRISERVEEDFGRGTYSVHNLEDYHRYLAQFRQELSPTAKLQHVTFRAKSEVKVPKLDTVLSTLKDVLKEGQPNANFSDAHVLAEYQNISGGHWGKEGSTAKKLLDALEKKGYGAIVDEMDAGVIGETPLVFFGRSLAGEKSNSTINDNDIHDAERSLIEIANRKT